MNDTFDSKTATAHGLYPANVGLKWGVLATAVTTVLGLAASGQANAADSRVELATGSRATATALNVQGSTITVSTATVRNDNAFNSFSHFEVGDNAVVNLVLPTGSNNLINLVWDSKALINGTLNSYYAGLPGVTAGRVFFADPHGMVVGTSGVLNVGALSVSTPTTAFMTTLLGNDAAGASATADFLQGRMPLSEEGSVSILGRINAQDDVRIQAHAIDASGVIWVANGGGAAALDSQVPVNTGAGTGVRLVNDGGNILLVAADSATVSGTLHANGGDVIVQSDNTLDVGAGAVLDARRTAAVAANGASTGSSTGASGNITLAGRDIHVDAGALLDAHATNGQAAGDITVAAAARAGGESGLVNADAQVHVDGAVTGRNLSFTASAQADTSWDDTSAPVAGIAGALLTGVTDLADTALGGDLAYLAVNTNATVAVGATAVLNATGATALNAATRQSITSSATALQGDAAPQNALSVGALYASLDTTAAATVASGAHVTSTGALDVKSSTDNTLDVTATSFAVEGTTVATTVAISDVRIDSTASIAKGAVLNVDGVGVDAHNQSSLETSSIARADAQGAVGLAAAISLQDVQATATLGANVTTPGNVTVQAASLTDKNVTKALVAAPNSAPVTVASAAAGSGDKSSAVAGLLGNGFAKLSGKLGEQADDKDGAKDPTEAEKFRAGAAMTYVDGGHGATAQILDDTTVNATGNLVVHGEVVDKGISASGISTIDAKKPDDGSNTGSAGAISAGVNLVNLSHDAVAEVGKNANLTAARLGVGSAVSLPMDFSALGNAVPDFSSLSGFVTSVVAAKDLVKKPGDLFTSYAAGSSSAGDAAVGGSINMFTVNNTSRAWIGEGAHLTSTAAANATAPWTTALDGSNRKADWTQAIAVSAFTRNEALHEAGALGLSLKQGQTAPSGAAVGGSFNDVVYDSTTVAGIAADAVLVSNGGVAVEATTKDTVVAMALASGGGGSVGVEGTMAMLDLTSVTHASISRDASITARALDVAATEDLFAWSIAGALAMSNSLSVGVSVGLQHLATDTQAYIGDNDADAPLMVATTSTAGSGSVHADQVAIDARTQGLAGVIAAAGAQAKSDPVSTPEKPGVIDKAKTSANGKIDGLRAAAADKMANLPILGGLSDKVRGAQGASAGQPDEKPQPKFGIAVSGSAAVNLVDQATKASLDGAHIAGRNSAAVDVGVQALNDSTLATASGAAAVSSAKAESSQFSAAIGGAVSYAVVDNETHASIADSVLTDASNVAVEALSGGEQTNVALGLSINKSTKQDTAVSVAGSFSLGSSSNETKAWLANSTLAAHAGDATRDATLAAYNRTYLGIGAGSLYSGGKGGIGAALTVADIGDTTEAAVTGGSLSGYRDVSVQAIDAARIVAGAAIAGGGEQTNGFAGAVVYNTVHDVTKARVDGGASIEATGDLAVQAFSSAPIAAYEDRLNAINGDSAFDYSGSAVTLDVDGVAQDTAGTSILSIAGLLQSGKNNAGLAFVGNSVHNAHTVAIGAATLKAGGIATLSAADHTAIQSFSIGIGKATGQFAGMGNATANLVGNTTQVLIGDAGASTNTTSLEAASIDASALDATSIGSFAGNLVIGSKSAAGAAVTYNDVDNTTQVQVARTKVTTTGTAAFKATNAADITAAAIAGTVANNAAISGSFAWSETGNTTLASVANSRLDVGSLGVSATSSADIQTLSGAIAISKQTAVGAAINIATVDDGTTAELKDSQVDADGAVKVAAAATGAEKTLAVAGAASKDIAVGGSSSTNTINLTVDAKASGLGGLANGSGVRATTVDILADNTSTAQSLAGSIAVGGKVAVGGAIATSFINGGTHATLDNSVLAATQGLNVKATSAALIETLAGAGTASQVGISGTAASNFITRDTGATLSDSSLDQAGVDVSVAAKDSSQIKSLAGSLAIGSNGAVGAAVAVNQIGGDVTARVLGGSHNRQLHALNLTVSASADADGVADGNNISTMAAGLGVAGSVGGAGSVAVNLMEGTVTAEIAQGADVLAERNIGVLANNRQGIDVFAGALGGGSAAGIGLGTVVNVLDATTSASITGASTKVTALARDPNSALSVDSGTLANPGASDASDVQSFADYVAPDLSDTTVRVTGLAVNAATKQRVATLGTSMAVSVTPAASLALAAMAGVNVVGGSTTALIQDAQVNQHADQGRAGAGQDVDVRASSQAVASNFIVGFAAGGGGSAAGAVATNVFENQTSAGIDRANVDARDGIAINANATQNSLAVGIGLAAGLVGGAGTAVVNTFHSDTEAFAQGGSLDANTLTIAARNRNAASLVGGAVAGGGAAIAGTFAIGLSDISTKAWLGGTTARTDVDMDGAVSVTANTDTEFNGVVVSGAGAGGAAVAGMAQVNVVGNTTEALVSNTDLDAASLAVDAHEDLVLRAYSGALAVSGGVGVGAGANVAILGSHVTGAVRDSDVATSGDVTVGASADRDIDMVTVTVGAGGTTGIGGAASLLLSGVGGTGSSATELGGTFNQLTALGNSDKVDDTAVGGTLDADHKAALKASSTVGLAGAMAGKADVVSATITGGSVAAHEVNVTALNELSSSNLAGGAGVGGVGVGGALAFSGLYGVTQAGIEGATVDTTGKVDISATNRDGASGASAKVTSYAGGAGIVGVGAAVAVAQLGQTVHATAGGIFTGGNNSVFTVKASDASSVDVDAVGAAAGAAAAGIVVATGTRTSHVTAEVLDDASISGYTGLQVNAGSTGGIDVYGLGASGGLLAAGTGVGVTATDSTDVLAQVGEGAAVNTGSGGTQVTANARPAVSAEGAGAAVGGAVGLGAVIVTAGSSNQVIAHVGDDATFSGAGGLTVQATLDHADGVDNVHAKSTAGSGGIYLSASAATANASNSAQVSASTGDNVALPTGAINLLATNTTSQQAEGTGVAVGGIAVGAVVVDASSNTVTAATLGSNNHRDDPNVAPSAVAVKALGSDRNAAAARAGAGGLLAGNAALATTHSTADVDALIGAGTQLDVASLVLQAKHDTLYAATADSLNASLVGYSGANVSNQAYSNVQASVGADTGLWSQSGIDLTARNEFHSDLGDDATTVQGAAGGVFSGSAAGVHTTLGSDTGVSIGDRASLATGLSAASTANDLSAVASTYVDTEDTASLTTGGAIAVAAVSSEFDGTFDNRVDVGRDANLASLGYVNLGTYTQAAIASTALVNTWGLAAVGVSDSDIDVDTSDVVNVGGNSSLSSLRNTYITAGSDSTGLQDSRFLLGSTSEGYVRGLIAVPNSSASASVDGTASVDLAAGSNVLSASNVTVATNGATDQLNVSGVGHGYQLGFIPVTQRDTNTHASHTGSLTLDGTVLAGRYNQLDIDIAADGTLTQSSGLPVLATHLVNFTPKAFLDSLCASAPEADGCKALVALKGSVADGAVDAWQLGPMFAAGGDVFLKSDAINGAGSVTANGAPSISVVNNSNYYLLLDQIELPDYQGGKVRFTGSANSAGNVGVTQAAADAQPSVLIHNASTTTNGPAIFVMEDIRNIGGLVHLRNDQGSLGQFGTVYAQQQIVEAPNGIVTFNNLNKDFKSGSEPQADWRNYMIRPADPNAAVAWIGSVQYGAGSGNLTNTLLYREGGGIYAGSSIVLFGGCLPHVNGTCANYPQGQVGFYGVNMPVVNLVNVNRSIAAYSDNPSVATNAANNSFKGQQIYVRARYIDINSTIDAGAGTDWSLKVLDETGLANWLDAKDLSGGGLLEIPPQYLGSTGDGSRQIKAWYDTTNKKIVVDNVNASGGGYVFLDGQIVSSTPYGKIKVSSGFGQVHIDSTADRALQVQDVNVGSGAVGVVEIVDRTKYNLQGGYLTTWYVSKQGQATQAFDNLYGATAYDGSDARALSNATTYNPTAGMRYNWTETAYVKRADKDGSWYWVNSAGQRVDPGQEWTTSNQGFTQGAAGGAVFSQTATGSFDDLAYQGVNYGCDDQYGGCNYGFPVASGGNQWSTSRDGWQTSWMYAYALHGSLSLVGSVKADNAIAIDFSGATQGVVDIKADGNLLLTGKISNQGGVTSLQADGTAKGGAGDIIKATDQASITSRDVAITATGGVGVGTNSRGPLDITTTGGGIDVNAGSAGIDLRVQSDAAVKLVAGNASSGYGNVRLVANGNITGLANASTDVTGGNITLTSLFGGIGAAGDPLVLAAHETAQANNGISGGVVNASAMNDIVLTDTSGDFWIGSVVSQSGDVALRAPNGGLLDASLRTSADVLSDAQIAKIRTQLKLDGSGVADSIAAFEAQVAARYQEYWRLKGLGNLDAGGTFVANANAIALFKPLAGAALNLADPTDAQVRDYIASRYESLDTFFTSTYGTAWAQQAQFTTQVGNYHYTATAAQTADLSKNAAWTDDQLRYSINANALKPSAGSVGAADPTVAGRNVSLTARDGIGRLASDLSIDYADLLGGRLGDDQALALALANTPGDVQLIAPDGHVLTSAELQALNTSGMSAGAIASVRIKRTSPLFIQATGQFDGSAGGSAFVQGNGDLKIGRFTSGADARITASGSLIDADSDGVAALVTGGDLVLAAGSGNIGGTPANGGSQPLDVRVAGHLLSVSAGQDARIRQVDGDLRIGSVFASGTASLDVVDGDLVSYLEGLTIDGRDVSLVASGDIGHRVDGAGALTGALKLNVAGSGLLNGDAGGRAWITSPDQALHVGTFASTGNLDLSVGTGDLSAQQLISRAGNVTVGADGQVDLARVETAGTATLSATGDLRATVLEARTADLQAGGDMAVGRATVTEGFNAVAAGGFTLDDNGAVLANDIAVQAASLAMGAGSRMVAADTLGLTTRGDMTLGALVVDASTDGVGAITLAAGGRLDANGDGQVNLQGDVDATATMTAGQGMGTASTPVQVAIGNLANATSTTGDIHLSLPQGGKVGTVQAVAGDIALAADGLLAIDQALASGTLRVAATDLDARTLVATAGDVDIVVVNQADIGRATAGRDATLTSTGLAVQSIEAGRDLAATALADLRLDTGTAGANATLAAGHGLSAGLLTVGDDLVAGAGTLLEVDKGTASGRASLSGEDIVLAALDVGGQLDATASADFTAHRLSVLGDAQIAATDLRVDTGVLSKRAQLRSAATTTLGTLAVGGDLDAVTSTALAIGTATVAGNARLETGGNARIDALEVTGHLDAITNGNLWLTQGATGGDARLDTKGDARLDTLDVAGVLLAHTGGNLVLGQGRVAGDATLQTDADTTIATLVVDGELQADTHGTLSLITGKVGGDARLDSGGDNRIDALDVAGVLLAHAGGDLVLGQGHVAGNATLQSDADTTIATLDVDGDLQADTHGTLSLTTGRIGGDARLASGGDTRIDALDVAGVLLAHAGGDLVLGQGHVAGNATLQSDADTTIATLDVDGDLQADTHGTLSLTTGRIGGDARLDSGGNARIDALDVAGVLRAHTGGDLVLGQGQVGGDATLQSGATTTIGALDVGGNFDSIAGTTLQAGRLGVGGNASLVAADIDVTRAAVAGEAGTTSTSNTHVGQATVEGRLLAQAGGDLSIDHATIGTTATLRSGAATTLGDVTTGDTLDMVSRHDIRYANLESGADILGTSTDGHILGGNARAKGRINFLASGDIGFDAIEAGTQIALSAGRDIAGDSARATAGDLVATAGRDLQLQVAQAGRDVLLDAQRTMTLGTVKAGRDIGLAAGNSVRFGTLDAVNDLRATSHAGDIEGEAILAGHDAILNALGHVQLGTAGIGHDLSIDAGQAINVGRYAVGNNVVLDAATDITIGIGQANGGTAYAAGGSIGFDTVGGKSRIDMLSAGGDITGGDLSAPVAQLAARDHIQLDLAHIDTRLNLAASEINANVVQPASARDPLSMVLTGYQDGVAKRITMSVDARDAWVMDHLSALQARLTTTSSNVTITEGHIEDSLDLTTPFGRTWMNNLATTLQPAQVQLTQPTFDFELKQVQNYTFTDAFVVRYGEGYWVDAPNHVADRDWVGTDYYAESALRYTFRTLQADARQDAQDQAQVRAVAASQAGARRDLVETPPQGAVNTGISQ